MVGCEAGASPGEVEGWWDSCRCVGLVLCLQFGTLDFD